MLLLALVLLSRLATLLLLLLLLKSLLVQWRSGAVLNEPLLLLHGRANGGLLLMRDLLLEDELALEL